MNSTLIGQMGTFLVLWWFVHKYIWPSFSQAVREEQQKINNSNSMADQARFAMIEAQEKAETLVQEAKSQATEIITRAKRDADKLVVDAKEEAKNTGQRELATAREEIEQEKNRVREVLRQQLASLVIQGVEQVVGREVKKEDHTQLLHELSEKL